jgi:predicted  nucleic acid-binding Zn-ribbon protein
MLPPTSMKIENPHLTSLMNQLFSSYLEIEDIESRTKKDIPQLAHNKTEIKNLKKSILEILKSSKASIQNEIRDFEEKVEYKQASLVALPHHEQKSYPSKDAMPSTKHYTHCF